MCSDCDLIETKSFCLCFLCPQMKVYFVCVCVFLSLGFTDKKGACFVLFCFILFVFKELLFSMRFLQSYSAGLWPVRGEA